MIVEAALTAFLKHKFSHTLQFGGLERVKPPAARPGVNYLLYVHIPYCEELCPYCSFNRFPFEANQAKRYFDALTQEIRMYADLGFNFTSVYVGGGTPTVMPDEMCRVLDMVREQFPVREISLETNPNHLNATVLDKLKDAGVNRLSVGVQSFDDTLLTQMERFHKYGSGESIKESLSSIMGRFDTLNVDMIFNFPTQTGDMLQRDLEIIRTIRADQVTFYPLMISDMTKREISRRFGPLSYRREKDYYGMIVDALRADYVFGTAWCFSRKKSMIDEYIVDYDEYVGAGSGSFGYVSGSCVANTFSIPEYVDAIQRGELPLSARKDFSFREQIHYDFMMKLFGTSLDVGRVETKFEGAFLRTLRKELALFRALGAVREDGGFLKLTEKGRYFWVIMMREFFTGVNNFRDMCRGHVKPDERCI